MQSRKAQSPILVTLSGIMVFWQPRISVLVAVWIIALHCSRLSYTVLPSATTIEVREEQCQKALFTILVTPSGITMEVREEQPSKACFPILVTLSGITMEVREEQYLKAELPILVTPSGIMVFWQPRISVLVAVWIIALHCSRLSYLVLPSATTIEVIEEQPLKAELPRLVTLFPITKEVRDVQPLKACCPILVTPCPIIRDAMEVQF